MSNNSRHTRPPLTYIPDFLDFYAQTKNNNGEDVTVIQVGANDGKINDPIHDYIVKYKWRGVLLEPQTFVFEEELKKTYKGHDKIVLENKAIASEEGELPFYIISFSNARWATGITSFDKSTLEEQIASGRVKRQAQKHGETLPEKEEDYIKTIKVQTCSFDHLVEKHQLSKIDFLCVDVEGFDYEILKLFNFDKFSPEVVLFESKNLSDQDFLESQDYLRKYGYKLFWFKGDTLAIKYDYPFGKRLISYFKALKRKM